MRLILRKLQRLSGVFSSGANGFLRVPASSIFVAPKSCYNVQTNSYETYNVSYAEAMSVNLGEFSFKSSPEDITNDLVQQLGISPVSGVENSFTLPPGHLYQVIRRSPNDHVDTESVLERLNKWNPHFPFFLRISFHMRILISRLDQYYALHITEMQLLADSVIQALPNRKVTIERAVRNILTNLQVCDTIDVDLHLLCARTADLITDYKSYELQYIVNWIMLYLDNAQQYMHMPNQERPIDDQLLYKNGSPIPPYTMHLGSLAAVNLPYAEMKHRDTLIVRSHDRDLVGYLHCYINLLADEREDLQQRISFAASIMKIRHSFFVEEGEPDAAPQRYSSDEYYECMSYLTAYLPRLPLLDKIPNANMLCNQMIGKLQTFSFQA